MLSPAAGQPHIGHITRPISRPQILKFRKGVSSDGDYYRCPGSLPIRTATLHKVADLSEAMIRYVISGNCGSGKSVSAAPGFAASPEPSCRGTPHGTDHCKTAATAQLPSHAVPLPPRTPDRYSPYRHNSFWRYCTGTGTRCCNIPAVFHGMSV